jgi:hypothetical protein
MSYPPPPPPAYPPAPQQPERLRGRTPRRLGWIFLALAVVLFVVGGIVLATKSLGKVNDFDRLSIANGGGTVTLDGTGKYVGYYEAGNVTDSIDRIPSFRAAVLDPSGDPVQLQRYGNRSDGKVKKLTYGYNGHHGAAAFQFKVTTKGEYRIQLQAVDDLPSDAQVAIGRDISGGTIAGGLLIVAAVLALIASIVLLIVGFVKRARHKRELQSGSAFGGPPSGYGQPAFGTPGGYPPPSGTPYGQPPPSGYQPGQQPGYQPGYQPGQQPGYQPGYPPPPPGGYQPPSTGDQPWSGERPPQS